MGNFKWLHFSDLHFSPNESFDTIQARRAFLSCLEEENFSCDYVFITGDIANKGNYDNVEKQMAELVGKLNVDKSNIFWAVGNHDIKRGYRMRETVIHDIRSKQDNLDLRPFEDALNDGETRELLTNKGMSDYLETHQAVLDRGLTSDQISDAHVFYPLLHCNLVVLNTCLTSCDDDDHHKLMLAEPRLYEIFDNVEDKSKPLIVIGHHNKELFFHSDARKLSSFFDDAGVDLYLCGHAHRLGYSPFDGAGRDIPQFTCGGGATEDPNLFTFMYGEYDDTKKEISITPYSYYGYGIKRFDKDYNRHRRLQENNSFNLPRLDSLSKSSTTVHGSKSLWGQQTAKAISVCKSKPILLVTANPNETAALLEDKEFFVYTSGNRSSIPEDALYYDIGRFGHYDAVHFQLPQQGSARAESSALSLETAIRAHEPCAVILVGIAFGKDYGEEGEGYQRIGDVLVSSLMTDYESGKVKDGKLKPDGVIAEPGRQLFSAFQYKSATWEYRINRKQAKCEFGNILSGDKVVDDRAFKEKLFDLYPRAIGGEMEGRGAYFACRRHNLNEWIIVKAICDWGDGSKSKDKQKRQRQAADSAVSLLKHVFSDKDALSKLYNSKEPEDESEAPHYLLDQNKNLPITRNPYLIGRENILGNLQKRIEADYPKIQLTGMGGIGKTAVLQELYCQYFDLCKAGSTTVSRFAYIEYIENLDNSIMGLNLGRDPDDIQDQWRMLTNLAKKEKILLLIDDASGDAKTSSSSYIKDKSFVKLFAVNLDIAVVFAARKWLATEGYSFIPISVGGLSEEECLQVFANARARACNDGSDGSSAAVVAQEDKDSLLKILKDRAGLNTLAVERLGGIAGYKDCGISTLGELLELKSFEIRIGEDDDEKLQEQINKLYAINDIEKFAGFERSQAVSVLEAFSLFPALQLSADCCARWMQADSEVALEDMRELFLSLWKSTWLERQGEGSNASYSMHAIVAAAVQGQQRKLYSAKEMLEKHIGLIRACIDDISWTSEETFKVAMPYVGATDKIASFFAQASLELEAKREEAGLVAVLFSWLGSYYNDYGEYTKALELNKKALAICEKVLGVEHPSTATTYNNIGGVYSDQGDYPKALEFYGKALAIREKVLGVEHPSTATTYNNIGGVYSYQGDYPKALEFYIVSYKIFFVVLGDSHPNTETVMANMASAYQSIASVEPFDQWLQRKLILAEDTPG
ncbi:MAG: tetratricopeptide repeat protein [Eubacteriaceae bacterium]|nr:tetratricopeptide repeat protein [Eubacteriaceae bacterium]